MNSTETPLKIRHTFLDFLYWNLVVFVPFIAACIAIAETSIAWLIIVFHEQFEAVEFAILKTCLMLQLQKGKCKPGISPMFDRPDLFACLILDLQ